mgnify:CR=1 FL=1
MPSSRMSMVDRLISLHTAEEVAASNWADFGKIPTSEKVMYKEGVCALRLPLHSHEITSFMLYLDGLASTGRVIHNCKKIVTCISGGFKDEVSEVEVAQGGSLTWYANTPHILTATRHHTVLFLQMFNPNT